MGRLWPLGPQVLLASAAISVTQNRRLRVLGSKARSPCLKPPGSPIETLRDLCQAWDLEETDSAYRSFIHKFAPILDALSADALTPEIAFTLRIMLIHVYRRALPDPGLPSDIMPQTWSGRQATELTAQVYTILKQPAQAYLENTVVGVDGALPPGGLFLAFGTIS